MENLELAAIGAEIVVPFASPYRSAGRGPSGPNRPGAPKDRLSELTDWWAAVSGSAPPKRVEQLWLSRPGSAGAARAEVVLRRFDAPDDVREAIGWGVAVADDAVDDGTELLLVSIPAGADDVSWQVLAAHLLTQDAVEATGWPAAGGLTDDDWIARVVATRDRLQSLRRVGRGDGQEHLLVQLGSPAIAAGTGLLLRAASRRTPALLDGPGAIACALLANRISDAASSWWRAADGGVAGLPEQMLTELDLTPLTSFGLRSEDGTAARIALSLLETALFRTVEDPAHPHDDGDGDSGGDGVNGRDDAQLIGD